jgi:hypothetical protein
MDCSCVGYHVSNYLDPSWDKSNVSNYLDPSWDKSNESIGGLKIMKNHIAQSLGRCNTTANLLERACKRGVTSLNIFLNKNILYSSRITWA